MFLFVDGQPVVLRFAQVEQLFYQAYRARFPDDAVSLTQWRGRYEYQALYPAMQLMVENGVITNDALNTVLNSIAAVNEKIKRPAVLASRVTERFAEAGYEATIRIPDATTKGIVAICIDQKGGDDQFIGELIRDEMLPAGQHMEGDVVYPTALSNGQAIDIKWTLPVDVTNDYRVTIQRARGSRYPEDSVDEIIVKFNTNFDEQMGIGTDITPQTYLTVRDLPWATSVLVEWTDDGTTWHPEDVAVPYNRRYLANLPPANVFII